MLLIVVSLVFALLPVCLLHVFLCVACLLFRVVVSSGGGSVDVVGAAAAVVD